MKKTAIGSVLTLVALNLSLANAQSTYQPSFLSSSQPPSSLSSYEVMCRNKAKEIAVETYANCMTDERQTQIDQIRTEYKDQLTTLKEEYSLKLKKLSETTSETTSEATPHSEATNNETNSDVNKNENDINPEAQITDKSTANDVSTTDNADQDGIEAVIVDTAESTPPHQEESIETVVTIAPMAHQLDTAPADEEKSTQSASNSKPSSNTTSSVTDQEVTSSAKKTEMTVSLKQIKKVVPVKNKVDNKKQAAAAAATTKKAKKSVKKTTVAKKPGRALPAKKIKSQSIDLNSPSELHKSDIAKKNNSSNKTEVVDVRAR